MLSSSSSPSTRAARPRFATEACSCALVHHTFRQSRRGLSQPICCCRFQRAAKPSIANTRSPPEKETLHIGSVRHGPVVGRISAIAHTLARERGCSLRRGGTPGHAKSPPMDLRRRRESSAAGHGEQPYGHGEGPPNAEDARSPWRPNLARRSFLLELALVLLDELPDIFGHVEQLEPLLLVP